MREDIARWNRKYLKAADWIDPAGEPELQQLASMLPGRGLALELACGKGANALYLAQIGYEVIAVDCAVNGLVICQRAARRLDLPVHAAAVDIDRIVLPCKSFDLIVVVRYLNRSLWPRLASFLAPGGVLFYKTFNQSHLETVPGFNAQYVLGPGELNRAFDTLERLAESESGTYSFILCQAPK